MKKRITIMVLLLIAIMTTNVLAATVTMEVVEDNICTIELNEYSTLEKKLINTELEKHKVTLQLKISNEPQMIAPSGELMIVIDSSSSMNDIVEGETTRKDIVLESANKLVNKLLEANSESLKIGVVTFSSSSEKDENGYYIIGTEADAQKVCEFTNDAKVLNESISAIEGTGQYTNLDAGLQLAKSQFSNEENNKYMIVLTDGLPNLAVGYNDLVTYEGMVNVIAQTRKTLESLENVKLITMLTCISDEEAVFRKEGENIYTYGQVTQTVFGTEESPKQGKFYKISDTEIEETIIEETYKDLLPVERTLTNITVIDYIPEEIAKNFNITLAEDSKEMSAIISEDQRTITWKIENLKPAETKILKFDLVLKEQFEESIINKILNTNEKVDITYTDYEEADNYNTSDVTPKIKLIANDIAPVPLPDAGTPIFAYAILAMCAMAIFFRYKSI